MDPIPVKIEDHDRLMTSGNFLGDVSTSSCSLLATYISKAFLPVGASRLAHADFHDLRVPFLMRRSRRLLGAYVDQIRPPQGSLSLTIIATGPVLIAFVARVQSVGLLARPGIDRAAAQAPRPASSRAALGLYIQIATPGNRLLRILASRANTDFNRVRSGFCQGTSPSCVPTLPASKSTSGSLD